MGDFRTFGLEEWLNHIQRQHWRTMELRLDRVTEVWNRLDRPRPPVVMTVAGTNGKGSCVTMLESVIRQAGNRTGSYTSPHLVRYNERICIDGTPIDDAPILEAFRHIETARGETGLTYFEFGTLCALLVFAVHAVDVAIMEVGMGGRLDAVNMVENDLALITSIGLDHQQWLGSDRELIGREKAGVINPGSLAVSADPDPPASISAIASAREAVLLQCGKDYLVELEEGGGSCRWRSDHAAVPLSWRRMSGLPLVLPGDWQRLNLGGVVAALALTRSFTGVSPEHLFSGLSRIRLPGRCQIVNHDPVTILDVAHNEDAAAGLSRFLDANVVSGETHAVFGVLCDKELNGILKDLGSRVDYWHLAGIADERGQSGEQLAGKLRLTFPDMKAEIYDNAVGAFEGARSRAGPNDRVVAFGSFHIVGDIIGTLESSGSPVS